MKDVVQIGCPHCRATLRVPASWAELPLRCKHCQQPFQAHRRVPPLAGSRKDGNNGFPVAMPAVASVAQVTPNKKQIKVATRRVRLDAKLVVLGTCIAAVIAVFVFGPVLQRMFNVGSPPVESAKSKEELPAKIAPEKVTPFTQPKEDPESSPAPKNDPPTSGIKDKLPQEKPKEIGKKKSISPALKPIIAELALLPSATGGKGPSFDPSDAPEFPESVLESYKADYNSILEFSAKEAQFPLRAALAKTVTALNSVNNIKLRNPIPIGLDDMKLVGLKNQIKAEQENVAQRALVLKELVPELSDIGDKHKGAESKRCQVLFDYTMLRLKSRVVHLYEYNYNLALVRSDTLPQPTDQDKVYRLTPQAKVLVNESFIKQYVKDLKKGWTELVKNYADSPWAFLAPREQELPLGLAWQPAKQ